MEQTKRELIDMFKNQIFPSQARHLKNVNFEGKGEEDEQEYLRDTAILLDLAEKGLDYDTRLKADMVSILTDIQLQIMQLTTYFPNSGMMINRKDTIELIQEEINALKEATHEHTSE